MMLSERMLHTVQFHLHGSLEKGNYMVREQVSCCQGTGWGQRLAT